MTFQSSRSILAWVMTQVPADSREMAAVASGRSVRRQLRDCTGDQHRLLDQLLMDGGLLDTIDRYGDFLAGLARARATLVDRYGGLVPDDRWTTVTDADHEALRLDLAALGRPRAADLVPHRSGPARSAAAGWGLLYVVEGSRLGAVPLSAEMARRFGSAVPRSFLGTQPFDGVRWRRLCRQLERQAAGPTMEAAARAAFAVHIEELTP